MSAPYESICSQYKQKQAAESTKNCVEKGRPVTGNMQISEKSLILDVVMVTYGRSDLVRNSLNALFSSSPANSLRVTVVDNNSPDDTPDVIAQEFPQVKLLHRVDNPGFAVSNNQALSLTTAPFILLLNPDTEARWPTIEYLIDQLRQDTTIGMIGCRLLLEDGSFDHAAKRNIPTPIQAIQFFVSRLFGRKVGNYLANNVPESGVGDVDALNGAFMLVTRAAFDKVGGLDERYWMYAEDLDWCVRFRRAGLRVVYDGRVAALHVKGASAGKRRNLKLNYHFHKSMALFYQRHLARSSWRALNAAVIFVIWLRFALVQMTTIALNGVVKLQRLARMRHK